MVDASTVDAPSRCGWCGTDPLYVAYHDTEWGVPERDDRRLFEMLILEGAQAGLSWITILRKRDRYRDVFEGFDPERVARFDAGRVERLLADPGIVRNRLKVEATIGNARAFLALAESGVGFSAHLWGFVDGVPLQSRHRDASTVPARTPRSDAMSKDLKRRGFRFVGSTICHAFMQATGMVNDHLMHCFRWSECGGG
ncbi:MAG: DNA-3-methyladenine glycosylase I [Ectothiorhodospiraceae bacterium]|nr:DNA-3-methyladenine glycosylase I [Chromatiales bacterium]MCP5154750.1 DNA-3-methyladenine glycosylase I [Ectothiorhodospiraceae bacterium]